MPIKYTAKAGDCISSIGFEHGLFAETLWDHPENQKLKELRKDMNTLHPGDTVSIPDLRVKEVSGASEQRHRFRRKGVPARFRVQMLNNDQPISRTQFVLDAGGQLQTGRTDNEGMIDVPISPDARQA